MARKKKFRHGFKAEANRYAAEFREELGVPPHSPLCPWKLADFLAVPIYKVSERPDCHEKAYLTIGGGKNEFDATVCYEGLSAFILSNDSQTIKRQASNIAHELAHIVLRHPPTPPFDEDGNRDFLREIEDEAEWFGPTLLVCDKAAMHAYRLIQSKQYTLSSLSDEWAVTEDVLKMRMNVVGAKRRYH